MAAAVAGVNPAGAHPAAGIALIVGAATCFALMDTTVSVIGAFVAIAVVLWLRYAIHALVMALWIGAAAGKSFRTANPRFQLLRGSLLLFSSAMAFTALRHIPVAEFTAIVMLTPLLATLLAWLVLHERVSLPRWALVLLGLAGALVMMRPGSGLFGWAALLPLAAALSNASFQILTSRFAAREDPFTTNFYTGVTGVALASVLLLASGADLGDSLAQMRTPQMALLLTIGTLGTAGHLLLIMAFGKAPASTLMPFQYTQIGVAALAGALFLGKLPDAWSWLGMALITGAGAASAWLTVREAAARQQPVTALAADTVVD
ncbi:MAG: DMT family transporter [Burkholderiaceae bacterium]|nr:DMT family transporter [Burkholderiaceae bacterium]